MVVMLFVDGPASPADARRRDPARSHDAAAAGGGRAGDADRVLHAGPDRAVRDGTVKDAGWYDSRGRGGFAPRRARTAPRRPTGRAPFGARSASISPQHVVTAARRRPSCSRTKCAVLQRCESRVMRVRDACESYRTLSGSTSTDALRAMFGHRSQRCAQAPAASPRATCLSERTARGARRAAA